jgi:hypothetical protein
MHPTQVMRLSQAHYQGGGESGLERDQRRVGGWGVPSRHCLFLEEPVSRGRNHQRGEEPNLVRKQPDDGPVVRDCGSGSFDSFFRLFV